MMLIVGITVLGQVLDCLAQIHSYNLKTPTPREEEEYKTVAKLSKQVLIALNDYLNGWESRPTKYQGHIIRLSLI